MTHAGLVRRRFFAALWKETQVVWPILSLLVVAQLMLGMVVGLLEGWRLVDATYFTFVTGLTIGYGDLVPARVAARLIALVIGFSGIVLTGLVAAIGVRALQVATAPEAHATSGADSHNTVSRSAG